MPCFNFQEHLTKFFSFVTSLGVLLLLLILLVLVPLSYPIISEKLLHNPTFGIDVMKVIYSWPVSVLVLILIIISTFQKEIRKKLIDLISIKHSNTCAQWQQPQEDLPAISSNGDPRTGEISWEQWSLDIITKFSPRDREIISGLGQQQQNAINFWVKQWWFEKVWGQIYATQIEILETVAQKNEMSVQDVIPFFIKHTEKLSQSTLPLRERITDPSKTPSYYHEYVHFLKSANLIIESGSVIKETDLTRPFLEYIAQQGYSKLGRIL